MVVVVSDELGITGGVRLVYISPHSSQFRLEEKVRIENMKLV